MTPLPENVESRWLEYLSIEEKKRFFVIKNQQRKLSFLYGRILARYMLSEKYGMDIARWEFSADGPVSVLNAPEPVSLNISHSGDFVVCGISAGDIGVDIERLNNNRPFMAVAEAYFTKAEYLSLNSCFQAVDRMYLFYLIWVIKESCAKCYKLTVFDGLKDVEVHCDSISGIKEANVRFSSNKKGFLSVGFYGNYVFSVYQKSAAGVCGHVLVLDNSFKIKFLRETDFKEISAVVVKEQ